jgi:hypothetical protein
MYEFDEFNDFDKSTIYTSDAPGARHFKSSLISDPEEIKIGHFTPFRIEDSQLAAHPSAREAGVLNEKRCNSSLVYIRTDVKSCSNLTGIDKQYIDKDNLQHFLEYDSCGRQHDIDNNHNNDFLDEGDDEKNMTTVPLDVVRQSSSRIKMNNVLQEFSTNRPKYDDVDIDIDMELGFSSDNVEEWNADQDLFSSKKYGDNITPTFTALFKNPTTFSATFTKIVNNLFENPEGRMTNFQRVTIVLFTAFEAYRTIISSFLIVFVPQNCGGYSCTILQNIIPRDKLEIAAITVNTFMALYFCALFSIERIRETTVKTHLMPDKTFSTDKEFLVKMLSEMNTEDKTQILKINRIYRAFAQFLLLVFFVNAGISCVVIHKNYLNNTTSTVFITNTFFMINRIYKALKITSSGEYNIYSAYRSNSLLYNRYRGKITETSIR